MGVHLEILRAADPQQRARWNEMADRLPAERRDVYFRPQYLEALEAIGRGEAICAVASDVDAIWMYPFLRVPLEGFESEIPRSLCDLQSGYGYGGPVVSVTGEDADFLDAAWSRFSQWTDGEGVVSEFIRFHPLIENVRWAPRGMAVSHNRTTVVIDAASYPDAVWSEPYFRVQRHMVRRAEREGYQFEVVPFTGDLGWFSQMYDVTQERLEAGAETRFGESYFTALRDGFAEDAWLGTVKSGGEIVVAVLVLSGETYAHCHLMGYQRGKLTNGMTNLVYHGIFLEAARRGLRLVHMGGGTSGAADDALLKFKKSLSPEVREFHIGTLVRDMQVYEEIGQAWQARGNARPAGFLMFYRLPAASPIR